MNAIWECRLQGSKWTWIIFWGASKTYQQNPTTISKNGYIIVKGRPYKVSTSKTRKHGHAKCHFVASDIFNGKKLEYIVSYSHNCDVPHGNHNAFQLTEKYGDGFVSLLANNGNTKDDIRLPFDEQLFTHIKDGLGEGKYLILTVMYANVITKFPTYNT